MFGTVFFSLDVDAGVLETAGTGAGLCLVGLGAVGGGGTGGAAFLSDANLRDRTPVPRAKFALLLTNASSATGLSLFFGRAGISEMLVSRVIFNDTKKTQLSRQAWPVSFFFCLMLTVQKEQIAALC